MKKPLPLPEVSESDFGDFQEESRERPAPIRDDELQSFLAAVHEKAQRERFAAVGSAA
jgi:hypothetical protein